MSEPSRPEEVKKWDKVASSFDNANRSVEWRFGDEKKKLFSQCTGKILLVAVGTGLDLEYFPSGSEIFGVDFSGEMLGRAASRAKLSGRNVKLFRIDVHKLAFKDNVFDTVATSCTFCSVPNPVLGLKELYRALKAGGKIIMFEHVRSAIPGMGLMMDIMAPIIKKIGPEINRRTRDNIEKAGFRVLSEKNIYLDMVKGFIATKPG